MSRSVKAEVNFRPLGVDDSELELLRACFAKNNDRQRTTAALAWLYRDHAAPGRSFGEVAETAAGDRLAAIYATLPVWVRCGSERRLGLQSLDTVTDADYRRRGLFVTLAHATYERAAVQGVPFVYGFPNTNSAPGLFNKLGWDRLDAAPFLIRPLRLRYVASRVNALQGVQRWVPNRPLVMPRLPLPRGRRLVTLERFDQRATALWHDFRNQGVTVAVERDADYLNWRIAQKPGETYRTLALETADGTLDALCCFTVKAKHGGQVGYLLELLHRSGATVPAALLLAHAVREMANAGADALLAWGLPQSPNRLCYTLNGFMPLPERLRPIELQWGVRVLDPQVGPLLRDRRQWYLSYLDADTI
jgi:GNAT superfamily N-acetyltransferase